ncbi:hypothetical protein SUDANB174_07622 [Streptomyces sp. enrichment culture]
MPSEVDGQERPERRTHPQAQDLGEELGGQVPVTRVHGGLVQQHAGRRKFGRGWRVLLVSEHR